MSELLHITRAAELVNLPELILVAECELGRLPHIVTADGIHIDEDDLDAWSEADFYDDVTGVLDWQDIAPLAWIGCALIVTAICSGTAGFMIGAAS